MSAAPNGARVSIIVLSPGSAWPRRCSVASACVQRRGHGRGVDRLVSLGQPRADGDQPGADERAGGAAGRVLEGRAAAHERLPRRPAEAVDGRDGGAQPAHHARAVVAVPGRGVEPAQLAFDLLDGRQRAGAGRRGPARPSCRRDASSSAVAARRAAVAPATLAAPAAGIAVPATSGPMLVNAGDEAVASSSALSSSSSQKSESDIPVMSSEVTNSPMSGLYGCSPARSSRAATSL